MKDSRAIDDTNQQIAELSILIEKCQEDIDKNKRLIQKSEVPVLTPEELKEAIENTHNKLKNGNWVQKDIVIRTLFLNLHIDNEKVTSYPWREPFSSLVEATDVLYGRSLKTLFETQPLEYLLADMTVGWNVIRKEALSPVLVGAYNNDYEL